MYLSAGLTEGVQSLQDSVLVSAPRIVLEDFVSLTDAKKKGLGSESISVYVNEELNFSFTSNNIIQ